MINLLFSNKKILIALLGFLILMVFIVNIFLNRSIDKEPELLFEEGVAMNIENLNIYHDIKVGQTLESDLSKYKEQLIRSQSLPSGKIIYRFKTSSTFNDILVITENSKVVYKSVPSIDSVSYQTPLINNYIQRYGQPELIQKKPSVFYDNPFTELYIYSNSGFALLINPNTGEVFEIQNFVPMPKETYLQFIQENLHEEGEVQGPV